MAKKPSTEARRPVLVCVRGKEDLRTLQTILTAQSADAVVCADIPELCRKISDQVEAAFIGGEVLSAEANQRIAEALDAQPDWSDLPIIVSVPGGADSPISVNAARDLGNVFVLDYPCTPAALTNLLVVAFRSRERQRWIRDLTKECEHATTALRQSQRQLEQKVQERTSELAERAAQLRRLTGDLILSEQRERRRVAKILHDELQQLLVSAKYRVASLNRTEDPAVKVAAQELEHILGETIKASRSLTSELSPPPILHEGGLRRGMEWLISLMATQNGLSVQLEMDEDFSQIDENTKVLLFDSVRELLSNAAGHGMVKNAEVRVQRNRDEMLEIMVSDRGHGFVPSTEQQKGFGLLRIRHRLELIGGRLQIKSEPGKGSDISILVPLALVAPPPADSGPQGGTAIPRVEKPLSGMIRLLIVDDHAVMRQGLSTSLGQEPDIAIIGEAADGKTALEKARVLHPDVILMDLGMPRMSGIEATRIIHSEMPRVRVIGLSMFEEKERANAMFEAGAVAYLSKSCSVDALTSTIRRCAGNLNYR
jgi:signal transduction histidine kinase/CheY-like chemotaxis protein